MEKDMTKGSPLPVILRFTLPLIIGNIFQQLYNMADTIIVGRYVGADALAAVGSTGTIMFLVLGFAQGITAGFTVLTSQRFGAKDTSGVKRSVANGILLALLFTVVLTFFSMISMRALREPDMQPFSPREFLLCSVFFIFIAPCRICGRKNTTGSFMRQIPAISSRWAFRWHSSLPSPHPVQ